MFTWLPPMVWNDLVHGRPRGYLFVLPIAYLAYLVLCAGGTACHWLWWSLQRKIPEVAPPPPEELALEGEILPPEFPRRGC